LARQLLFHILTGITPKNLEDRQMKNALLKLSQSIFVFIIASSIYIPFSRAVDLDELSEGNPQVKQRGVLRLADPCTAEAAACLQSSETPENCARHRYECVARQTTSCYARLSAWCDTMSDYYQAPDSPNGQGSDYGNCTVTRFWWDTSAPADSDCQDLTPKIKPKKFYPQN
jgi:hypothetical protein